MQSNPIYVERISEHDARLAYEGRWLLERATVLEPEEFLDLHFKPESSSTSDIGSSLISHNKKPINDDRASSSSQEPTSQNQTTIANQTKVSHAPSNTRDIPNEYISVFTGLHAAVYSSEVDLYEPLVSPWCSAERPSLISQKKNAINTVLSESETGSGYYCFNVSRVRSPVGLGTSLQATLSPDLVVTPDYPKARNSRNAKNPILPYGVNVFTRGHVSFEIELFDGHDCGFDTLGRIHESDIERCLDYSKAHLILQSLRSVILGQFTTLPYRYIFHLTITGKKLRMWKFSPTGVELTTAINYTENPEPFIKFLMLMKQCPVSGIGLNVGKYQMFQELSDHSPHLNQKLLTIAGLYSNQSKNTEWLTHLNKEAGYWLFHPDISNDYKPKFASIKPYSNTMVVFRKPIHRICSINSRATRCYLAVELSFLEGGFNNATDQEKLQHMHTLKTSWHDSMRIHEFDFHSLFTERRLKDGLSTIPTRLATALAGGVIPHTTQHQGRTEVTFTPSRANPSEGLNEPALEVEQELEIDDQKTSSLYELDTTSEIGDQKAHCPYKFHPHSVNYLRTKKSEKDQLAPEDSDSSLDISIVTGSSPLKGRRIRPVNPVLEKSVSLHSNRTTEIEVQQKKNPEVDGLTKELRWILFKQVGGRLDGFCNAKELVQVIVDATIGP